jgi:NitT/TauT family transport system substrate-binding protein
VNTRLASLARTLSGIGSVLLGLLALGGCSRPPPTTTAAGAAPTKVRFQTDWYPQAEHGGHYQALARGFYAEAGLDVEIMPGGPGAFVAQKLATGQADLAMGRGDDVFLAVSQGLPLLIVAALMQHDPQCLLLHEENPVSSFADLNGKAIMAAPGATWIEHVKARYRIDFSLIPLNYGLAQFMSDKAFIQQAFITNEPFYVRQAGARPKTLLIADSGCDSYRVIITSQRFARENPEAVRAFVAQSIRGWDDFLRGDPAPGKALIAARNEKMSDEFMGYSIEAMRRYRLVEGHADRGERTGLLTRRRLQEQIDLLATLKILERPLTVDQAVSFDFLPPELRALASAP